MMNDAVGKRSKLNVYDEVALIQCAKSETTSICINCNNCTCGKKKKKSIKSNKGIAEILAESNIEFG